MKKIACAFFFTGLLAATSLGAAELNPTSTLTDQAAPSDIPAATEPQFVPTIGDLPLMTGLHPVADEDTLFIARGAGRIAESYAEGSVDVDDVYDFYRNSLPQLGWKMLSPRSYQREQDQLRIDAKADGKITRVRFTVSPAS